VVGFSVSCELSVRVATKGVRGACASGERRWAKRLRGRFDAWFGCEANMKDFTMRLARMLSSLQGIVEIRG